MAIDKMILKMKKNNKGVSLVEVLVTIAMIVIIAGPLINSLLNSRLVNSNARVIQNGTIAAQDMAEQFKAIEIDELLGKYNDKYEYEESTGIYTFKDISVNGPDGENFLVDVTLDPTAYTSGSGNTDGKVEVNNVSTPGLSSIYGSNCIKLYKYYVAADQDLKEMFAGKVTDSNALSQMYNSQRENLSKSTDIKIVCKYNKNTERYEYNIALDMNYYFKYQEGVNWKTATVKHSEVVEGITFAKEQIHSIYLVCPVFDIYYKGTEIPAATGNMYADDSINITYEMANPTEGIQPNLYFYLAEQETPSANPSANVFNMRLNPSKVKVNNADLSIYNVNNSKLKLCTNMINLDRNKVPNLTYSDKLSGISIYEMNIEVKNKGKVIAEFTTTK